MGRVWELLKRPGRKPAITSAAPTQVPQRGSADSIAGYVVFEKKHRLDRWLDRVVKASGSSLTLLFTIGFLFAWGMFGIKYHHEEKWQVILSDVQSIVNYVYDSLLIRQLLNLYSEEMVAMAQVQSRLVSHERMLTVLQQWREEGHEFSDQLQIDVTTMKTPLPQENKFSQFIERAAHFIGHLVCIIGFWVGVVIWLGVGTLDDFSDHWQLCMNTATSGLMVFAFGFLANMRERRASYSKKCFDSIFVVDSVLETKLRSITMDANENETVVIPAPKMNPVQRGIFYYADFVGTLVGIAILICVIIAWLVVGPVMEFDDNWWLLIGTYAGLIGMHDAFILRNMQARLNGYVDQQLQKVDATDCLLFEHVGIPMPDLEPIEDNSVTTRISHMVGRACGHELTVIGDIFLIIGLLAASTAMRWSMTGQLVSNIPPNLIEGFLMIVLISGDNIIDAKKLANLRRIHKRRLALLTAIESDAATVADTEKGSIRKNSVTITVSEKVELSNTIDLV